MENVFEKIELIKQKFISLGFPDATMKIIEVQMSGGTPGEVFAGVSFFLYQLKQNNSLEYLDTKEEINEILEYAKKLNYIQ